MSLGGKMDKPVAIDLFCGAGGMSEGITQAGFHIVFSNEINEASAKTYRNRHEQLGLFHGENTYLSVEDIRELSGKNIIGRVNSLDYFQNSRVEKIDVVFGGPPCQGFSTAGKRKQNDPRNYLFREYLRIIKEIQPNYIVLENVVGFLSSKLDHFESLSSEKIYQDNSKVKEILEEELDLMGYKYLEPRILDASEYGVPQRRLRLIFIAYKEGITAPEYPKPITLDTKVTLEDAISDFYYSDIAKSKYQFESKNGRTRKFDGSFLEWDGELANTDLTNHSLEVKERFSLLNEGENLRGLRSRILKEGIDLIETPSLLVKIQKEYKKKISKKELLKKFKIGDVDSDLVQLLLTKKNARTKLSRNEPGLTVTTLPDDYISPYENRILSVREMARIQSFDDSFEFLGPRTTGGKLRKSENPQYTQVGNAVPPLLARAVAESIIKAIKK